MVAETTLQTGVYAIGAAAVAVAVVAGFWDASFKRDPHPIDIVRPLVQHYETLNLEPYWDEGHAAVGYGHDLSGHPDLRDIRPITEAEADSLLHEDLTVAYNAVLRNTDESNLPLNDDQLAALTDFVFNEGEGHFEHSTLLINIRAGLLNRVPEELRRWIYAGGEVSENLKRRREAEIRMWNGKPWNTDD